MLGGTFDGSSKPLPGRSTHLAGASPSARKATTPLSVTDNPTGSASNGSGTQDVGVPVALATATDFIMVRAELVKFFGNDPGRALVFTRILYRADSRWHEAHEVDGLWYWRATRETIAEETGLSPDQVKRILSWLTEHGYIEATAFQLGGYWDQTRSLRAVIIDGAESPDARAESPDDGAESHNVIGAESPNLPSTEEVKKTLDDPGFENAWKAWPNKNAKKAAKLKFDTAIRKKLISRDDLEREIIRHGEAFRTTTSSEFTPYLATWLNQERWTDPIGRPTIPAQQAGWDQHRKIHDPRVDGPVNPYRNEV